MKYLGVDYGSSFIGLAMGDSESRLALPYDTIEEKDKERQVALVQQVVVDEEIDEVVIGFPISLEGTEEEQAEATDRFMSDLTNELAVPIHREDERFSSQLAQRQMQEDSGGKYDEHALAAAAILQTFLDRK
jgi:putative holliday junction resolvase